MLVAYGSDVALSPESIEQVSQAFFEPGGGIKDAMLLVVEGEGRSGREDKMIDFGDTCEDDRDDRLLCITPATSSRR